jgi:myo-inositol 2-dehydrogenase/D-chiro-inositol 1-dehydrogenase
MVRITSRDPAPPPIEYIKVSGGIFLDMTIHDFDMARYVTGSEVVEVYAQGGVMVDPAIGEAGDLDTVVVMMRHENGAITTIDNSRQAVYGYDQRVFFIERYIPSYVDQWSDFVRTARGEAPSPVTIADGRAPLVLGLAAWKSIHEGRPVGVGEIGST